MSDAKKLREDEESSDDEEEDMELVVEEEVNIDFEGAIWSFLQLFRIVMSLRF